MQILAVVVRYNMPLDQSQTLLGLCDALSTHPDLAEAYRLLIWDNSPEALADPQLSIPFVYRHSNRNLGVSGAYNNAMEYAEQHGHIWMVFFDQDSAVTSDLLRTLLRHSRNLENRTDIVAIAPTVKMGAYTASPKILGFNGRTHDYPAGECGIADGRVIAVNSGCVMRTSALRSIGGFSTDFWLDFSDLYVFHQFFLTGKKVWRAGDTEFQHEMTMLDYDGLMSPWRYKNYLYAETAYSDLYFGRIERLMQHLKLPARAIKQRILFKNPDFSRLTLEQFMYRLRVRRSKRLLRFRAEGVRRLNPSGGQVSDRALANGKPEPVDIKA